MDLTYKLQRTVTVNFFIPKLIFPEILYLIHRQADRLQEERK